MKGSQIARLIDLELSNCMVGTMKTKAMRDVGGVETASPLHKSKNPEAVGNHPQRGFFTAGVYEARPMPAG
jgi:hypothetical protein